jgi:ribosomal protein S25
MVLFDQATYDKLLVEAPKFKLVTPSILSDRMRVSLRINFMFLCCYLVLYFSEYEV